MKRSLHHHRSPTSDSIKNLSKTDSDSLIIQPFTHGARCYAFHPPPTFGVSVLFLTHSPLLEKGKTIAATSGV
jgi:hypothetical protein